MYFYGYNTLIGIMILVSFIILYYCNTKRTKVIENFFDDNIYDVKGCLKDQELVNGLCKYTTDVEIEMVPLSTELINLIDLNIDLTGQLTTLTDSNTKLSKDLLNSNNHRSNLAVTNSILTDSNAYLTETVSNYQSISNLLGEMDQLQLRVNALSNLENTIVNETCSNLDIGSSNCSLISIEKLTKEKLQNVLQEHINMIPSLSKSYILAVKLWIAYKKACGGDDPNCLVSNSDQKMQEAKEAYDDTMRNLKAGEQSMYAVKELYSLYNSNFYYTESNIESNIESNAADFTLSNASSNYNIVFVGSSNYKYVDDYYIVDHPYSKLFETCTSSNTLSNHLADSNIFDVKGVICGSSSYSEIVESISNCDNRDTCKKEQDSNIQSGLEYIYRDEFDRVYINGYSDTNDASSDQKNQVDENIIKTFLFKVFNDIS